MKAGIPAGIVAALGLTQIIGYGTPTTASASLRPQWHTTSA